MEANRSKRKQKQLNIEWLMVGAGPRRQGVPGRGFTVPTDRACEKIISQFSVKKITKSRQQERHCAK